VSMGLWMSAPLTSSPQPLSLGERGESHPSRHALETGGEGGQSRGWGGGGEGPRDLTPDCHARRPGRGANAYDAGP
jgi:hypothetical protein